MGLELTQREKELLFIYYNFEPSQNEEYPDYEWLEAHAFLLERMSQLSQCDKITFVHLSTEFMSDEHKKGELKAVMLDLAVLIEKLMITLNHTDDATEMYKGLMTIITDELMKLQSCYRNLNEKYEEFIKVPLEKYIKPIEEEYNLGVTKYGQDNKY